MQNERDFYAHFQEMLSVPYGHWDMNLAEEEKDRWNKKAKEILYTFYQELSKAKPSEIYDEGRFHTSYIIQLFAIRKALEEGNYVIVCWELATLIHHEPFLQPRIYYNVLRILEHYLDIKGENG